MKNHITLLGESSGELHFYFTFWINYIQNRINQSITSTWRRNILTSSSGFSLPFGCFSRKFPASRTTTKYIWLCIWLSQKTMHLLQNSLFIVSELPKLLIFHLSVPYFHRACCYNMWCRASWFASLPWLSLCTICIAPWPFPISSVVQPLLPLKASYILLHPSSP
jgi:hypothetical protein